MGLSISGLVRAATESTLNIVNPSRAIARTIESGDPTHLVPFGQSYKEWGSQLSSVLKKPAQDALDGVAQGLEPELSVAKSGAKLVRENKDTVSNLAMLASPVFGLGLKIGLSSGR